MEIREFKENEGREERVEGEVEEEERKEHDGLFRYRGRLMAKDEIKSSLSLNNMKDQQKEVEEESQNPYYT